MAGRVRIAATAAVLLAVGMAAQAAPPRQDSRQHAQAEARAQLAALRAARDPFADVYAVTSRATFDGLDGTLHALAKRRDATGAELVVSRVRAHALGEVSAYIHEQERRCGGYFAFATRAQAEAFVRGDRSAQAIAGKALASYAIDNQATVSRWLPQVAEPNLRATIAHLQGYQNRWYASATGVESAQWIRDRWQALAGPRTDVSTELFTACGNCGGQPSVILTIAGVETPGEVLVLGAHLDSINRNGGGATQRAPGADDDASGIAVLTETLRIALASGWRPQRNVKVMGYAAEEVGLRGSNAIAQAHRNAGSNVVGVLQVDMTNYKSGAVPDMRLVTDYSNAELKTFFAALFDAYLAPMGLVRGTDTCGYACSDHASWTAAGYPAAMMFEAGDPGGAFPYIHTTSDTLATMGDTATHSVKFAQFALAFLGELAKTTAIPPMSGNLPPELVRTPAPSPGAAPSQPSRATGQNARPREARAVREGVSRPLRSGSRPRSSVP